MPSHCRPAPPLPAPQVLMQQQKQMETWRPAARLRR
jgi:hypothetical protein